MTLRVGERIVFVCEGGADVGFGHVSRCISMAEALEEEGVSCAFLGRFEDGADRLLSAASMPFESSQGATPRERVADSIQRLMQDPPLALVADDYNLSEADLASLNAFAPTLFFDDFNLFETYPCAAVLNPVADVAPLVYPQNGPALFIGPDYLPVRRSLRQARAAHLEPLQTCNRVLVAIGGSDRWGLTARVVDALYVAAPEVTVHAVVGDSFDEKAIVSSAMARFETECRLLGQLPSLTSELAWADVVVSGGGMTKYEAAYLGVPPIVVSKTPEESKESLRFAALGLSIDLGFGPALGDAAMAAALEPVLRDVHHLQRIQRTGLATFPPDPTANLARAFLKTIRPRK